MKFEAKYLFLWFYVFNCCGSDALLNINSFYIPEDEIHFFLPGNPEAASKSLNIFYEETSRPLSKCLKDGRICLSEKVNSNMLVKHLDPKICIPIHILNLFTNQKIAQLFGNNIFDLSKEYLKLSIINDRRIEAELLYFQFHEILTNNYFNIVQLETLLSLNKYAKSNLMHFKKHSASNKNKLDDFFLNLRVLERVLTSNLRNSNGKMIMIQRELSKRLRSRDKILVNKLNLESLENAVYLNKDTLLDKLQNSSVLLKLIDTFVYEFSLLSNYLITSNSKKNFLKKYSDKILLKQFLDDQSTKITQVYNNNIDLYKTKNRNLLELKRKLKIKLNNFFNNYEIKSNFIYDIEDFINTQVEIIKIKHQFHLYRTIIDSFTAQKTE